MMTLSKLLALRRWKYVKCFPVFGNGPAGHINPLLLEHLNDFLVAQRLTLILSVHKGLYFLLDSL